LSAFAPVAIACCTNLSLKGHAAIMLNGVINFPLLGIIQ
jgi:hypothetical protein